MARSLCVILLLFFVSFFVSWTFVGPLLCVWIKSLKNHNKSPKSWKRKGNLKRYNWRDNAIHEKFVDLWLSHLIFAGWTGVATRSFFSWVLKLRHQVILVENSLIIFAGCTGVGLIIYGFWTMCKRRMKQSPARQTSLSSHGAVLWQKQGDCWLSKWRAEQELRMVAPLVTQKHMTIIHIYKQTEKKQSSLHCEWSHKSRSISCFLTDLQIHVCVWKACRRCDSAFRLRNCSPVVLNDRLRRDVRELKL